MKEKKPRKAVAEIAVVGTFELQHETEVEYMELPASEISKANGTWRNTAIIVERSGARFYLFSRVKPNTRTFTVDLHGGGRGGAGGVHHGPTSVGGTGGGGAGGGSAGPLGVPQVMELRLGPNGPELVPMGGGHPGAVTGNPIIDFIKGTFEKAMQPTVGNPNPLGVDPLSAAKDVLATDRPSDEQLRRDREQYDLAVKAALCQCERCMGRRAAKGIS